jgi:phosphatidylglycerophosphate synthase
MLNTHDPQYDAATQDLLRHIAAGLFFFTAATDAVDGYLARHRRQITRLGTFLDPLADKLLITSAALLLASDGGHVRGFPLPTMVVVLIISKDVVVVVGFIILYLITAQIHIVPVFAGKLATALAAYHGGGRVWCAGTGSGDSGISRVSAGALVVGGRSGGGGRTHLLLSWKPLY